MKSGVHPDYRPVVFRDSSTGDAFRTRSTVTSDRTIEWPDGRHYPVIDVETSSYSHPLWTGTARPVERGGQVEKFQRRYGARSRG
ncbi:type B 50S ribosomal protein L31 [Actinomycetospora cinnamomea]|uniref:Large ribosomal subunit protein bL31B n=1 Tax=Actinomycetospora cinnamomea TaxID=663609 RepID=A0A2U1EDM3_9PSEU|nr:type B 50S ribosomal protein L31 [Actinomycetospora cinnamomea]PVY98020.1 LSU ribosomal protein L31P [Actinomycetospora cinnamomea]